MDICQVNWLDLPTELLVIISEKLFNIKDYICFGCVCQSWHSIYLRNRQRFQLPIVLVLSRSDYPQTQFKLHNHLLEKGFFHLPFVVPEGYRFRGSTKGWLVFENGVKLHLLNPISSQLIRLPSLTDFKRKEGCNLFGSIDDNLYFYNVALSANPALNPNYIVMATDVQKHKLVFYKSWNRSWTSLQYDNPAGYIDDIIYYGDCFYVMDHSGEMWAYDVSSWRLPMVLKVAPHNIDSDNYYGGKKYLVISSGDLLQVTTIGKYFLYDGIYFSHKIERFKVFKLDQVAGKWVKTNTLCGQTLFLGDNSSVSLLASDYPGCKADCIYFTNEKWTVLRSNFHRANDMGVYNLEDRSTELLNPMENNTINPPTFIWIEPTLQEVPNN